MTVPREHLYNDALFMAFLAPLLAPGATLGGPIGGQLPGTPTLSRPFNIVSRETIEVQRVPPMLQPVLFMDEAIEEYVNNGSGLISIKATVYIHIGCTSQPGTPAASILNPLLDVVMHALAPDVYPEGLGLGDLVDTAQFSGLSVKNLGQNSTDPTYRQAVAYVPFELIFA